MKFDDLVDMDMQVEDLRRFADMVKNMDRYTKPGVSIPRGLFLEVSPYSQTDLVLRALSEECHAYIIDISQGNLTLEVAVETARDNQPALIILPCMYASSNGGPPKCVDAMKKVSPREQIFFVATTRNANNMHPDVLSMGLFENVVSIPKMSQRARESFLRHIGQEMVFDNDQVVSFLAKCAIDTTEEKLKIILNQAAIRALSENRKTITRNDAVVAYLDQKHGPRTTIELSEHEMKVCAYHEAGHAIVCYCSELRSSFLVATIVPRNGAGGQVLCRDSRVLDTAPRLKADLAVSMGGWAAEQIIFGNPSIGPHQDLIYASKMARNIVCKYGMGPSGLACLFPEDAATLNAAKTMSPSMQAMVESDVRVLLEEAQQTALNILRERRWKMGLLSEALARQQVVYPEDMAKILGE